MSEPTLARTALGLTWEDLARDAGDKLNHLRTRCNGLADAIHKARFAETKKAADAILEQAWCQYGPPITAQGIGGFLDPIRDESGLSAETCHRVLDYLFAQFILHHWPRPAAIIKGEENCEFLTRPIRDLMEFSAGRCAATPQEPT